MEFAERRGTVSSFRRVISFETGVFGRTKVRLDSANDLDSGGGSSGVLSSTGSFLQRFETRFTRAAWRMRGMLRADARAALPEYADGNLNFRKNWGRAVSRFAAFLPTCFGRTGSAKFRAKGNEA